MTEPEPYLAKARESLASSEADVEAGRYNSAANRAYYAAFQAAVAALIWAGIKPVKEDWGHRFVMDRFSVTLTKRRKLLPSEFSSSLDQLFDNRVIADYREADISRRVARSGINIARRIVATVEQLTKDGRVSEPNAEYRSTVMTTAAEYRAKAKGFVQEIKDLILAAYPDSTFEVIERTPKDYRMIVKGSFRDQLDIQNVIGCRKIDMLTDHDIWIVLLAEPINQAA